MSPSHVAVIDFGKTNVKVAVVDLVAGREVDERRIPNAVVREAPYPQYDTEGHWRFLIDALAGLAAEWPIGAVAITTHGATAAVVDAGGGLVLISCFFLYQAAEKELSPPEDDGFLTIQAEGDPNISLDQLERWTGQLGKLAKKFESVQYGFVVNGGQRSGTAGNTAFCAASP